MSTFLIFFLWLNVIICLGTLLALQINLYRNRKRIEQIRLEIEDRSEQRLQRIKDILELLYAVEDIMTKCSNAPAVSRLVKALSTVYSQEIDEIQAKVAEDVRRVSEERSSVRSCLIGGANQ